MGRESQAEEAHFSCRSLWAPGNRCCTTILESFTNGAGEIQKTVRAYQKAIAPNVPIVHLHIGSLEEESGNTGQAIQHYERFLATWDLDPTMTDKVRNSPTLLRRAPERLMKTPVPQPSGNGALNFGSHPSLVFKTAHYFCEFQICPGYCTLAKGRNLYCQRL